MRAKKDFSDSLSLSLSPLYNDLTFFVIFYFLLFGPDLAKIDLLGLDPNLVLGKHKPSCNTVLLLLIRALVLGPVPGQLVGVQQARVSRAQAPVSQLGPVVQLMRLTAVTSEQALGALLAAHQATHRA